MSIAELIYEDMVITSDDGIHVNPNRVQFKTISFVDTCTEIVDCHGNVFVRKANNEKDANNN
jgi:hypothetical protein